MTSTNDIDRKRERTIDLLTKCYSKDHLSLEQFESRVERAGIADTHDELALLLSDMPTQYRLGAGTRFGSAEHAPKSRRNSDSPSITHLTSEPRNSTSILSERKLEIDSTHSNAVAVLGSMKITVPELPADSGVVYVQVAAVLSEVTIVVPNGVTVDNRITPMLSELKDTASRAARGGPTLRLEGFCLMSEVKVRSGLPE